MGLCRWDLVKDLEFEVILDYPGGPNGSQGRRGVGAREGHTMMEAEAVLKQGLETEPDEPEDVVCPGLQMAPAQPTPIVVIVVFYSPGPSHSSSLGTRIGGIWQTDALPTKWGVDNARRGPPDLG